MSFCTWTLMVGCMALVVTCSKHVDVQHALQQLLGVPSGDRVSTPQTLPSYMMELYERYKSGDMLGAKQGNTVRSIQAVKDSKMAHRLLFNLSGIHQQEQVLRAELHLYQAPKRRGPNSANKRPPRVRLFAFKDDTQQRLESVQAQGNTKGWSVFDVTEGVRALRSRNSTGLLGVRSPRTPAPATRRKMGTRKMGSSSSVPFLIVFSQDKNSLQSDASLPPEANSESVNRRIVRSLMDNRVTEEDFGVRNNEFPEDDVGVKKVVKFDPSVLLTRGPSKSQFHRRTPGFGRDVVKRTRQRVPHFDNDPNKIDFCQRKKLVVDFAKIGWGEWIIFPKTFEAHYCAGACPFPLTKNVNPSNHATIQSLVHALGVSDGVPAPCCVPNSMSSMSLLYLDQDGDVVLKNYPHMTVESCACR